MYRFSRALVAGVVSFVVAVSGYGAAFGAVASPNAKALWNPNGVVYASIVSSGVLYIGGDFSSVTNPATSQTVHRRRLAAINLSTGALLPWHPGTNGAVHALAMSGTGHSIYVGGAFTTVNAHRHSRIVSIDTGSSNVRRSFKLSVNQLVSAIKVAHGQVYFTGAFTLLNTHPAKRIADVGGVYGHRRRSWNPELQHGNGMALAISPNGENLVVGGAFTDADDISRRFIASFRLTTGALTQLHPHEVCGKCAVLSLSTDGTSIYAATEGPGGHLAAFRSATSATRWTKHADGDVQAVLQTGGVVYAGGHFSAHFGGATRHTLAAVSAATGGVLSGFAPHPRPEYPGIWTITSGDRKLIVGGAFTSIDGSSAAYLTYFSL